MQRKRILSPKRQRFESQFENYITKKQVDDKLYDTSMPILDFDTQTKPQGTLNAKVNNKLKWEKAEKKRIEAESNTKSLPVMEKEGLEIQTEENQVLMSKDYLNKLKEVFDSCKERGREHIDEVETAELVSEIVQDPFFEPLLDQPARENVDSQKENLENLL